MGLQTVTKIGIGWTLAAVLGLYSFVLSKRDINERRYERMKERQRLRNLNTAN